LKRLLNSALVVDAAASLDFRNVADLTPEERTRGEAMRRFIKRPRPGDRKPRGRLGSHSP
jgi:hypothetical protein